MFNNPDLMNKASVNIKNEDFNGKITIKSN